jgi:hypothetical protein
MEHYSLIHRTNIFIHIIAGAIALLLGLLALTTAKGGKRHLKAGNLFMIFLTVVILTGLTGVFVFKRNTLLLIVTALSGYYGFSGYRVLRTKSNTP